MSNNHTPPSGGFGRLLSGLNNGWNLLSGGGSHEEDDESIETNDVNESVQNSNLNSTNDKNGEDASTSAKFTTPSSAGPSSDTVAVAKVLADVDDNNNKKRPATTPRRERENKKKKSQCNRNDVGLDSDIRKVSNPSEMQEAFDNGYDSDGWGGPPQGINQRELEEAEEDPVPTVAEGEALPNIAEAVDTGITEPTHVPISDEDLQGFNVAEIKHQLLIRRVDHPKSGPKAKKGKLLDRLKEALQQQRPVHPDIKKKAKGDCDMSAFAVGARWRELKPDVDVEEPINLEMPEAVAPTIPEAERKVPPRPKKHFSRTFDRPVFKGRQRGGPRDSFLKKHFLNAHSHPAEFAESFFPMFENREKDSKGNSFLSMEHIARCTNLKANLAFAGESTYVDWSGNFSVKEVRQHLGLYVLNGISPSPGLERKFDVEDKANFNVFVNEHMGGPTKNPKRRLRQFKAFMTLQDPRKEPPSRKDSPLFKLLPIVKWIQFVGPDSWECGIDLGLDEQTIGFKGRHVHKLRISYKAEGDGFQCDALCDEGFTYSVFFRNEVPPKELLDLGLCPLHARSIWLFDQLREDYHRVWVDNLYMSAKFAKTGYQSKNKVLLNGVARGIKGGVPPCVMQEGLKPSEEATVRGTVKAAVLEGDKDCPSLVAMSVYDTKPVHFVSMACESIQWIEKKRKVWNNERKEMVEIGFLRMNLNDDYNNKMNAVDISDQLRNQYRFDHWLRQRKWWWAIVIWGVGVLLTNSYKYYVRVMEEAGVQKKDRLTHYQFLHDVAVAWIDLSEVTPDVIRRRHKRAERLAKKAAEEAAEAAKAAAENGDSVQVASPPPVTPANRRRIPTRAAAAEAATPVPTTRVAAAAEVSPAMTPDPRKTPSSSPKRCVAVKVSDNSLHPVKGALKIRLSHFNMFHGPIPSKGKAPSCALHRYLMGRGEGTLSQKRGVFLCKICNVHLCLQCFDTFHTCHNIVEKKEELLKELTSKND